MGGFNQFLVIPEEVEKKLPFLGERFYYMYSNSAKEVYRGVVYEITRSNLGKALERLTGSENCDVEQDDRVYVLPNCRIPSFKLKEYMSSKGARLTPDITKATKIIGHNKIYVQTPVPGLSSLMFTVDLAQFESTADFSVYSDNSYLKQFKKAISTYVDISDGRECKDMLISKSVYNGNYFAFKHRTGRFITPTAALIIYYQILNKIPVVNENVVFNKIGKPVVINQENYDSIVSMLKSSDKDNHKIAAEIMANCDIDMSMHYLYKLCKLYYYDITNLSKYKNVRLFLKMSKWGELYNADAAEMLDKLYLAGSLTKESFDNLYECACKEYIESRDSSVIKVTLEPDQKFAQYVEPKHTIVISAVDNEVEIVSDDEVVDEEEVEE